MRDIRNSVGSSCEQNTEGIQNMSEVYLIVLDFIKLTQL